MLRVEVTPAPNADIGSRLGVTVEAVSTANTARIDSVRASTIRAAP